MSYRKRVFLMSSIFVVCLLFLVSCGGSSSDGGNTGSTTLSGIAAAGAPIVGKVNVKGANNATASSTIEGDGSFSLDVASLTAPYMLFAEGSVNGKSVKLFSCSVEAGAINISPVTDFIIRNVVRGDPQTAYDDWENNADATQINIDSATQKVMNQLAPLMNAASVPPDFNPMKSSFEADCTGFDKVLDGLTISYAGTTATVTNNYTGSSFVDDVTTSSDDANGLPANDETQTVTVMNDEQAIDVIFETLTDLFATDVPTEAELTNFFAAHVAPDFFRSGQNHNQTLNQWINGEHPAIGMTTHWVNVRKLESADLNNSSYTKGYEGRLYYNAPGDSDSFLTRAVYDGQKWLWYGDRKWIEYNLQPYANMEVDSTGSVYFTTGLQFYLQEPNNYAYNNGIRSAVITGPGLPVGGVVLTHGYPQDRFVLSDNGEWDYPLSDVEIDDIGDNEDYQIMLCSEDADVAGINNCSNDDNITITIAKPPVKNNELTTSYFPALTSPSSHALNAAHTGDVLDYAWTNPANMKVHGATLVWEDTADQHIELDTELLDSVTSAQFDSSTQLPASTWALLYLYGEDIYGRQFSTAWDFYGQP